MKVLLVNKFFYIKGGSETYYFSLKKLLQDNGHEVIDFSMKDDKNYESEYSEYFIDSIDYNGSQSVGSKGKIAGKIIYSFEAKRKIEQLIKATKPDIVHLQIFQHQMSPSILDVFKKYDIPVVYTAHDMKMVCPNYKMLNGSGICEDCKEGKYINCLKNSCVKESKAKSLINTIECYFHKYKNSYGIIDKVITPSKFYRDKFVEFGVENERVKYIPNFLKEDKYVPQYECKDYFLYFGRLSEEKGIKTLLDAMKLNDYQLKIVGTGPLQEELAEYINSSGLNERVVMEGYKSGAELEALVKDSMAVIVPSEWYENAPYSVIESMAQGKAIIGADIGGIPELIEENINGHIFKSKDSNELNEKMKKLVDNKEKLAFFGQMSRKKFQEEFTEEKHLKEILKVYDEAIKNHKNTYK